MLSFILSVAVLAGTSLVGAAPAKLPAPICTYVNLGANSSYANSALYAVSYTNGKQNTPIRLTSQGPKNAGRTILTPQGKTPVSEIDFGFSSCNALGYKTIKGASGTTYFGHLTISDYEGTYGCLGIRNNQKDPQLVYERDCLNYEDTPEQLTQFWSLHVPSDKSSFNQLYFLGKNASEYNARRAGYYNFNLPIVNGSQTLEGWFQDGLNYKSLYDLKIEASGYFGTGA